MVTALVTAQFSIDMEPTSFDSSSFFLAANSSSITASAISYDTGSNVATFVPAADLISDQEYFATITTAVRDSGEYNPLSTDYVWSFRIAPTLVPASLDSNGVFGNAVIITSDVDATGRYIVFVSTNTLVSGINTGGVAQIFRKDTLTGEVRFVSTNNTGLVAANGACSAPRISNDGRYVAFQSLATDFIAADTNGATDIFLHDTQTTTTTRVSVATDGTQANGASTAPSISADGRYIAFESAATNLPGVGVDTNGVSDIYRAHRTHQ